MSAPNLNVPLECGAGIPPASVLSFTWPSYDHTILRLVLINSQQWRSYLTESTWRPTRERRSATFPQAVFFSRTPEAVLSTLVPFGQCSYFLSCILSYTGTMTAMVILLLVLCWVCSFVRSSRFQKGHCFINLNIHMVRYYQTQQPRRTLFLSEDCVPLESGASVGFGLSFLV